jgi:hypothetical protein
VALFIEAKNKSIAKWYESYGAVALIDAPLLLILPKFLKIQIIK